MREQTVVIASFLVAVVSTSGLAQTPLAMKNLEHKSRQVSGAGMSAANPWIGSQVGFKFGGTKEFADNLLVSAQLLWEIETNSETFRLPVMGNLGDLVTSATSSKTEEEQTKQKLQELLTSSAGANVGVYPVLRLIKDHDDGKRVPISLTLHGSALWKLNAFSDPTDTRYLQQGKFTAGLEFGIGGGKADRWPATLSVTPALTVFSKNDYAKIFAESRSHLFAVEITGILPVGRGVGFLLEGIVGKSDRSSLRAGLIIAKELHK